MSTVMALLLEKERSVVLRSSHILTFLLKTSNRLRASWELRTPSNGDIYHFIEDMSWKEFFLNYIWTGSKIQDACYVLDNIVFEAEWNVHKIYTWSSNGQKLESERVIRPDKVHSSVFGTTSLFSSKQQYFLQS